MLYALRNREKIPIRRKPRPAGYATLNLVLLNSSVLTAIAMWAPIVGINYEPSHKLCQSSLILVLTKVSVYLIFPLWIPASIRVVQMSKNLCNLTILEKNILSKQKHCFYSIFHFNYCNTDSVAIIISLAWIYIHIRSFSIKRRRHIKLLIS